MSFHQATTSTVTRTAVQRALVLPEIRSQIGYFLLGCNRDLIACMLVCKAWKVDFRRLLFLDLSLTKRTFGPILLPLQWRSHSTHTLSLSIEEPTLIPRGNKLINKGYRQNNRSPVFKNNCPSDMSHEQVSLRSPDYNMDPATHCPNLLHLTVRLNSKLLPLCCWTRRDEWVEVGEDGVIQDERSTQNQEALFKTSVVVRYDRHQDAFLVKTSNRILSLLHHHPRLQTFRWIGVSDTHMDQLGKYLLTKQLQLVDLQLEQLKASVTELNCIISNCPKLRRLHLKTLHLEKEPNWPDITTGDKNESSMHLSTLFRMASLTNSDLTTSLVQFGQQTVQQEQQEQQNTTLAILNLQQVRYLTLESPHFPLLQLCIYAPALEKLCLSNCHFPTSFSHAVGANSSQQQENLDPDFDPSSSSSPHSPEFSVFWNCPQLQTYKHEDGSILPNLFVKGLMESSRENLHSVSLISYTVDQDFVTELINHDHYRVLTHLDLHSSTWIKSTDIQSLLCHCNELVDFTGPQNVLWGEDLVGSPMSWACLKLKRLQLLVCMARPDSVLWEQSVQQGQTHEPLGFPLQRILGPEAATRFLLSGKVTFDRYFQQQTQVGRSLEYVGKDEEEETKKQAEHGQEAKSDESITLKDIQLAIFQQLHKLTQLEFIDLTGGGSMSFHFLVEYPRGIPWTLHAGLDELKNLVKMKELVVTGWEDQMTRREAQWFRRHWPDLRAIINKSSNSVIQGHQEQTQSHLFSNGDEAIVASEDRHVGSSAASRAVFDNDECKPNESQVVGWLAFEICLAQEWPERFSRTNGI
ncbi:hypothetical protein BX616_001225 [Lobosporangium transversale]|nr:hypothetical protein BX616_001225 [Lobosporangium transversale]